MFTHGDSKVMGLPMSPPELGRCLYLTTTTNRCMVSFCKKYDVDKPYSSHFVQKLIGLNMSTVCFFLFRPVSILSIGCKIKLNNQQRDPISNLGIIHFLWNGHSILAPKQRLGILRFRLFRVFFSRVSCLGILLFRVFWAV